MLIVPHAVKPSVPTQLPHQRQVSPRTKRNGYYRRAGSTPARNQSSQQSDTEPAGTTTAGRRGGYSCGQGLQSQSAGVAVCPCAAIGAIAG